MLNLWPLQLGLEEADLEPWKATADSSYCIANTEQNVMTIKVPKLNY